MYHRRQLSEDISNFLVSDEENSAMVSGISPECIKDMWNKRINFIGTVSNSFG